MATNELIHYGVKGMKWGVRRYQNPDGSLTPAGEKRYDRDKRENAAKKKENRVDVSKPDPKRWAREDLQRTKKVVDSTSKLVEDAQSVTNNRKKEKIKNSFDLSDMSDSELRDQINRLNMERQYKELMSQQAELASGKDYVSSILGYAGKTLGVAGSALSIALAIKELRG